jgi:hypothetical protein
LASWKAVRLVGAGEAAASRSRSAALGGACAAGEGAKVGVGIMGPRLRRIISGAGEEGDSKALAGNRHMAVGGDVLLVSTGTHYSKDCT